MKARLLVTMTVLLLISVCGTLAGGKDELQRYFSNTAKEVKAAKDPVEKRRILGASLQTMSKALSVVRNSGAVSGAEYAGIDRFKATLKDKQDELLGVNGFARVSDDQLDNFSDYTLQDMEQAGEYITISVVTLLLIIVILLLIVR